MHLHGSAGRGEAAADLDLALMCDAGEPRGHAFEQLASRIQAEGAAGGPEIDLRSLTGVVEQYAGRLSRIQLETDRPSRGRSSRTQRRL